MSGFRRQAYKRSGKNQNHLYLCMLLKNLAYRLEIYGTLYSPAPSKGALQSKQTFTCVKINDFKHSYARSW